MNKHITAITLFSVLLSNPVYAGSNLDGRYAYYQARKTQQTDRGPRNDADCRQFIASDLYDADSGEHLVILGNRWDDGQDVSAVTGTVTLKKPSEGIIPFVIDVESEGNNGPMKGTLKKIGSLGISITISGRTLHYCKVE